MVNHDRPIEKLAAVYRVIWLKIELPKALKLAIGRIYSIADFTSCCIIGTTLASYQGFFFCHILLRGDG